MPKLMSLEVPLEVLFWLTILLRVPVKFQLKVELKAYGWHACLLLLGPPLNACQQFSPVFWTSCCVFEETLCFIRTCFFLGRVDARIPDSLFECLELRCKFSFKSLEKLHASFLLMIPLRILLRILLRIPWRNSLRSPLSNLLLNPLLILRNAFRIPFVNFFVESCLKHSNSFCPRPHSLSSRVLHVDERVT